MATKLPRDASPASQYDVHATERSSDVMVMMTVPSSTTHRTSATAETSSSKIKHVITLSTSYRSVHAGSVGDSEFCPSAHSRVKHALTSRRLET
ncbi:hypothetical protein BaRGS_00008200 [Batillaria attramentaria]|uniref:Uncharacterized protein n=1 Tax=Batillaria attramentaria TaxID=370345 RepID=A0ABD0LMU3_9CAEN